MEGCFGVAVVVLAGALLKQCLNLLSKGLHPTIISEAFHKASEKAVEVRLHLEFCSCCFIVSV